MLCHGSDAQSPACLWGDPVLIPSQPNEDIRWTVWHWDGFLRYFGFFWSSTCQCSIFIFIMILLSERQTGKVWTPSEEQSFEYLCTWQIVTYLLFCFLHRIGWIWYCESFPVPRDSTDSFVCQNICLRPSVGSLHQWHLVTIWVCVLCLYPEHLGTFISSRRSFHTAPFSQFEPSSCLQYLTHGPLVMLPTRTLGSVPAGFLIARILNDLANRRHSIWRRRR